MNKETARRLALYVTSGIVIYAMVAYCLFYFLRPIAVPVVTLIILTLVAAVFIIADFLVHYQLDTKSPFLISVDRLNEMIFVPEARKYGTLFGTREEREWYRKNREDIFVTADDGLKIHAYVVEQPQKAKSDRWAVLCHGYMANASAFCVPVVNFYKLGYNVLVFDARAAGKSEGTVIGMGAPERRYAVRFAEEISKKHKNAKIAIYGISMGGATAMMASGLKLPKNVKAIVEDCGYSSVWDQFASTSKMIYKMPAFPILYAVRFILKHRSEGYDIKKTSSLDAVSKSVTPTLFIHGADDVFVPFSMLDKVYDACKCDKEKLVVPGASHGMACLVDPDLYWSTVEDFLNRRMKR